MTIKLNKIDFNLDSALIDQELGFKISEIEFDLLKQAQAIAQSQDIYSLGKVLHQGNQTWVGLDPQTLQTPYGELQQICEFLKIKDDSQVIDLGAGYGRLGIVLFQYNPTVQFIGYEYVKERVDEGNRLFQLGGNTKARLYQQDLLQDGFTIPTGQYYFIYDYGFPPQIRQTLKQLELLAVNNDLVIIARGKGIRSQIHSEHPWLCQVFKPWHQENYSIYSNYYDLI